MDRFDIQVMLKDGSFADYEVTNNRDSNDFEILKEGKALAAFRANPDGTWSTLSNSENLDEDLQERITNQLNGYNR